MTRCGLLLAVLVLASRSPAAAQVDLRTAEPVAVVSAVLAADSVGDWRALLRLAHPEALRAFQASEIWGLQMLQSHIWDSMPSPFMSDSVQRRRIRSSLALRESQLLNTVYQVGTVDGLRALPAESVFARERRAATSLIHRWGSERRRPAIIGAVSQGDTLAFVVLVVPEWIGPDSMQTMFPMPPRRPSRAEVTTLRRVDGEWRSMMDYPGTGTMGGMTALPDSN